MNIWSELQNPGKNPSENSKANNSTADNTVGEISVLEPAKGRVDNKQSGLGI